MFKKCLIGISFLMIVTTLNCYATLNTIPTDPNGKPGAVPVSNDGNALRIDTHGQAAIKGYVVQSSGTTTLTNPIALEETQLMISSNVSTLRSAIVDDDAENVTIYLDTNTAVTLSTITAVSYDSRYYEKVSSGTANSITGVTEFTISVSQQPGYWSFSTKDLPDPDHEGILTMNFWGGQIKLVQGMPVGFPVNAEIKSLPAIFYGTELSASATYYYAISTLDK